MTTLQSINSQSPSHNATHSSPSVVDYHLDFSRFRQHLVDVTLSFTAEQDAPTLWLPAWIPGSYLMREFARNITAVHYQLADQDEGV